MIRLPENKIAPFGRRFRSSSLWLNGADVAVPVPLADDRVDVAMHEHRVNVFRAGLLRALDAGRRVGNRPASGVICEKRVGD